MVCSDVRSDVQGRRAATTKSFALQSLQAPHGDAPRIPHGCGHWIIYNH